MTDAPVKLLLVDDLDENLYALEALLKQEGVTTISARSGIEALELLLVHDVALAILDVQMPGMDGFELAELLRGSARTRFVPIIFVTAGSHDARRVFQGYDAGAVDFLYKPIEPRIMCNKVATFVSLHRQKLQLAEQVDLVARREREAGRLRDELAKTLELHELFVAAIGHDLRTPLSTVLTGSHLLRQSTSDPKQARVIERIASSGNRMQKMLDELSDLSRARLGGGITISTEPGVDLVELAERLVADAQTANPDRKLRLTSLGDAKGTWDRSGLEKVVSNLLSNALRHGSKEHPIDVGVDGTAPRVRITVGNAGEVRPDVMPHLFQPFRRSEEREASREGLGLGLFIVKELVSAHGGRVDVQTGEGRTAFVVELPRQPPPIRASPDDGPR